MNSLNTLLKTKKKYSACLILLLLIYFSPLLWLSYWHIANPNGTIIHNRQIALPWNWSVFPHCLGNKVIGLPSWCCVWMPWTNHNLGIIVPWVGKSALHAGYNKIFNHLYSIELKNTISSGSFYVVKSGIKYGICKITHEPSYIILKCYYPGGYNYYLAGKPNDIVYFMHLANRLRN